MINSAGGCTQYCLVNAGYHVEDEKKKSQPIKIIDSRMNSRTIVDVTIVIAFLWRSA